MILNPKILITKVELKDVRLISEIGAKTFKETFAKFNTGEDMKEYLEEKFDVRQIANEIKDIKNIFFLAMEDNRPIGYAKMTISKNPDELKVKKAIEIERIYVLKSHHDKKAGAALMEQCLTFATQKSFETIWLGVWENNPKAISFYEKWGFEMFGSHVFQLGKDSQTDLLMMRNL